MIKDMVSYIKHYLKPDSKVLRNKAAESANVYFSAKQETLAELVGYKRGYIKAYRSAYAKTKTQKEK